MSTLDDDLAHIDVGTTKLQKEWERFFSGQDRKAPFEATQKIERLVRRYLGSEIRNNTERFRFQTAAARFNTLNDMWTRRLRAIEEGRSPVPSRLRPAPPPPEEAKASAPGPSKRTSGRLPRPRQEVRLSTLREDDAQLRQLFERFIDARHVTGEPEVGFDSFRTFIAQERVRLLETKDAVAVDFRVAVQDGRVSLKAKPVRSA